MSYTPPSPLPTNWVDGDDSGDDAPGSTMVGFHATGHNDIGDAVNAIVDVLGSAPEGADADLTARLAQLLRTVYGGEDGYQSATIGGTVANIDLSLGNYCDFTLSANVTFTAFPTVAASKYCSFVVMFHQDGVTGGWGVSFPGNVVWSAGIAPTINPNINDQTEVFFFSVDAGTTWTGTVILPDQRQPINVYTASHQIVLGDLYSRVIMDVATGNAVTVPPAATVGVPLGAWFEVEQRGAGVTSMVRGTGVTINVAGGALVFGAQYTIVKLLYEGGDVWSMTGQGVAGGGAPPAPAAVLNTALHHSAAGEASPHTITFPAATAGSLLVCLYETGGTGHNAPTGQTSGWTVLSHDINNALGRANVAYKLVAAGGETSFAYTTASTDHSDMVYYEVANLTGTLDKHPTDTDSGASTVTSQPSGSTGTLSSANEFAVICCAAPGSLGTRSLTGGFTMDNGGTLFNCVMGHQLITATTALSSTPAWTSTAVEAAVVLVTFS